MHRRTRVKSRESKKRKESKWQKRNQHHPNVRQRPKARKRPDLKPRSYRRWAGEWDRAAPGCLGWAARWATKANRRPDCSRRLVCKHGISDQGTTHCQRTLKSLLLSEKNQERRGRSTTS